MTRRALWFSVACAAVAAPVLVLFVAVARAQAVDPAQAIPGDVTALLDAARAGQWIVASAVAVTLLGNLMRLPALGAMMTRIPKRWRIVVPVLLGGLAAVLHGVASGGGWVESIAVALFTGPMAVFGHEAVVEAVMGKADRRGSAI